MKRKFLVIIILSLISITGIISGYFIFLAQTPYNQVSKKIPSLDNEINWFIEDKCENAFFCNALDSERDPKIKMDLIENSLYFLGNFAQNCVTSQDTFFLNSTYNGTTLTIHFCLNTELRVACMCCYKTYGFIPNIPDNITTVIFDSYYDHEYSLDE